jgi:hypothetical protein
MLPLRHAASAIFAIGHAAMPLRRRRRFCHAMPADFSLSFHFLRFRYA